jgi:hypothetical protein
LIAVSAAAGAFGLLTVLPSSGGFEDDLILLLSSASGALPSIALNESASLPRGAYEVRQEVRLQASLLKFSKADTLALQAILCRAEIASADHRLSSAELAAGDQPHGSATRTGHDGDKWVLGVTQLGLILQDKYRSRVHSFRNPFFEKLQVG